MLVGKLFNGVQIRRARTVFLSKLLPAEIRPLRKGEFALLHHLFFERFEISRRAHPNGQASEFGAVNGTGRAGIGQQPALAAGKFDMSSHNVFPFG
jgi:hypothetical protein